MIAVTSRAMKEGRYVSSPPKGYSMLFCPKKRYNDVGLRI
tara:strand:- start:966 stop:1085 length:120 start_codon:yes stop_codon:yes gene_type:complete